PIPNRVVKPRRADGTALLRESRSSPSFYTESPQQYRGLFVFIPLPFLDLLSHFLFFPDSQISIQLRG
ncbi:MAG TPA: hypothetical protein VN371_02365, partial [Chlorobaculum sp.]|nr:hypothetical protein [Chlorobaculum sp.]